MTFVPEIPEKYVTVKISEREAVLLSKLRRYPFGKFLIVKANNLLIRIEITDQQLIEPTGGDSLG